MGWIFRVPQRDGMNLNWNPFRPHGFHFCQNLSCPKKFKVAPRLYMTYERARSMYICIWLAHHKWILNICDQLKLRFGRVVFEIRVTFSNCFNVLFLKCAHTVLARRKFIFLACTVESTLYLNEIAISIISISHTSLV